MDNEIVKINHEEEVKENENADTGLSLSVIEDGAKKVEDKMSKEELLELRANYLRLEQMVTSLVSSIAILVEDKNKINVKFDKKKLRLKIEGNSKAGLVGVKKVVLDGREVEVDEYETFAIIEGHKRKIYENKRGRLISYDGYPIYLSINRLETEAI